MRRNPYTYTEALAILNSRALLSHEYALKAGTREIRHYVDGNTIVLSVHNRGAGNQVGDAYYLSFGV